MHLQLFFWINRQQIQQLYRVPQVNCFLKKEYLDILKILTGANYRSGANHLYNFKCIDFTERFYQLFAKNAKVAVATAGCVFPICFKEYISTKRGTPANQERKIETFFISAE